MNPHEIHGLACARFGEPNSRLSTKHELRFGKNGSVSVVLNGEKAGLFFDHEAQSGGRLAGIADTNYQRPEPQRLSRGMAWGSNSERQFQREISSSVSMPPGQIISAPSGAVLPARDGDVAVYPLSDGRAVRCPLRGGETALYLHRRGIDRWPDHSIRASHTGVCYIARTADGTPLAVQVVPVIGIKRGLELNPDAGQKNRVYWPDGVTKRTYTTAHNWQSYAAVHLPGRGGIILCEGVETGLSIWLATGRPVACCLGLSGIRWLRCGKNITIATDGDEPGSPAAKYITETITERKKRGATVKVASPPIGHDFNDIHQIYGLAAVSEIIRKARTV